MVNLAEYKCLSCGQTLKYDVKTEKLKCEYCDSEYDLEAFEVNVDDSEAFIEWDDEINVYGCNFCGGQLLIEKTTSASNCPYCDSQIVIKNNLSGGAKPEYIIPFQLTKEDAKANLTKHLKSKRFLPKVFTDKNHIDEIKGVYIPFWLFNGKVNANYNLEATIEKQREDSVYKYEEVSHYMLSREGTFTFKYIPVDGSKKIDSKLMESLEPFDFTQSKPFNTSYLPGYLADRYDIDQKESFKRANNRIENSLEQLFLDSLRDYDSVNVKSKSLDLFDQSNFYVYYPVYFLNTTYQNEKYLFAMNGQSGKFVGDLPLDKGLYYQFLIKRLLFTTLILYAIGYFVF